jgi:hypothetical protein
VIVVATILSNKATNPGGADVTVPVTLGLYNVNRQSGNGNPVQRYGSSAALKQDGKDGMHVVIGVGIMQGTRGVPSQYCNNAL